MKFLVVTLFVFYYHTVVSQEKILHGKIIAETTVDGINIVNLVNEESAISNSKGEFHIRVKEGDLLIFSAINFEYKLKIIDHDDMIPGSVLIEMIPKVTQIDEVVITKNKSLDVVAMGILDRPAKQYTPAQRKLRTAGDFKPIQLLGLLGGQLPIDPIINAVNGKTKRLKKEINVEQREILLKQLDDLLDDDYYIQTLKIPAKYIKGFKFLVIEDEELVEIIKQNNKTHLSLRLIQLAEKYKNTDVDKN